MPAPFIPPKTAAKLASVPIPGTRHKEAMEIAVSLIGNSFSANAVYQQLRDHFPADVTDKELQDVVDFALRANPEPSGTGSTTPQRRYQGVRQSTAAPEPVKKTPLEHAQWWLNNATMTQESFVAKSQLPIPESPLESLVSVFELLYTGDEFLNVVCQYLESDKGKARPCGGGKTLRRDDWLLYLSSKGVPKSKAGAWFRPNPCSESGTGKDNAITDSDVQHFRFMLLESDVLPIEVQLALFAKLRLPISLVVLSGGLSAHAWVRIGAKDIHQYEARCRRILTTLEPFGIDQANKNPSRLSRLPGAVRTIGGENGGLQRLLWLNPGRPDMEDADLDRLEKSLRLPSVEEKPFARLIEEAIPRYEEMYKNRGKLGVPTGITRLDKVSGGLKPGGYTLVAAETGVGKTTMALNMINAALNAKIGTVLFSLEMSRDDVVDMMFSMNCNVDRNAFNTGEFTEKDFQKMASGITRMKNLPFWVDDKPDITVDEIRQRTLCLKQEANIGLAVVDYAQLALPDVRTDKREEAVAAVALGLRLISREANIPIIVLSQLNDEGRVRESRRLGHEAANLFVLSRDSGELNDPNITLTVKKGRKIPSQPIQLYLKAEYCKITERSPIDPADVPYNPTND